MGRIFSLDTNNSLAIKKRFGLRYYGFFSGQGGPGSYKYATAYDNNDNPTAWTYIKQPSANLFYGVGIDALFNFYEKNEHTFGVFAGVMIGGSSWLEGKSYYNGTCQWQQQNQDTGSPIGPCQTLNQYYSDSAKQANLPGKGGKATFSPTYVQFIVNIGFRTNFTKHQGFELGVRIPTINDPYYTVRNTLGNGNGWTGNGNLGDKMTIVFRRTVAIYANYVYNF
ncbi:outer membrane protein [Helicobacter cynogastricus]|uniref:outer membrane protein n=1 Tax=Helicobacter cynogastricus TaxID=329937 RepID=UPI001F3AF6C6|nr:outer membrane protein [Helicobacter cynogastricus]